MGLCSRHGLVEERLRQCGPAARHKCLNFLSSSRRRFTVERMRSHELQREANVPKTYGSHLFAQNSTGPESKTCMLFLVNFPTAVAYHLCLNLPATFSQPRTSIISGPSTRSRPRHFTNELLVHEFQLANER